MGDPLRADLLTWGKVVLRGVGQIIFQGHAGTGLFFLAGIAVSSPEAALGALSGACIGPGLAYVLKYDRRELVDGIYGFNATLVGVALMFYLDPGQVLPWLLLVVGCAASVVVTWAMRRFLKFPTYTSPFIVCTWILLLTAHAMKDKSIDHKPVATQAYLAPPNFVDEVLSGGAEIMFGANFLTGLLFVIGMALSNWRHAVESFLPRSLSSSRGGKRFAESE
jgi:urea transporter